MMLLVERSTMPQSIKKVNCPTCRRRTNVVEIAYVDNAYEKHELDTSLSQFNGRQKQDDENFVPLKGSYGTKVSISLRFLRICMLTRLGDLLDDFLTWLTRKVSLLGESLTSCLDLGCCGRRYCDVDYWLP